MLDSAHSPLRDVSYRRVYKTEEGRDEWSRPFRVSKGNFWKFENRTSVLLGKRVSAEMTPFQRIIAWLQAVINRQILCFTTD